MRKVIFVADFFDHQVLGGAELHDSVVAKHFEKQKLYQPQEIQWGEGR